MSARSVFADLLAAYRKEAGWTQAEAARRFTMSKSLFQKIEACDRKPQRDMADQCDELFGTHIVFARIYKDIVTEPHPAWFGPRVEYEDRATAITDWEQRGIPGMLQTEAYARAVVRACRPYDPPEEIGLTIQGRLERQDILARDRPPKLWAVVAEGVLRQLVGGREVMAEQLDHLVEVSKSSRAVIQVLSFGAVDAPGVDGPAALFEFEGQPPVAYLEGWYAGQVVEDPKEVASIATALNMIKGCALSPGDSRQLIAEIRG
ncbi:MAG: helix-turn-helix domain-containing protein [Trebonia sp.]